MKTYVPCIIPTTNVAHLKTLVENQQVFNAKHIELNIFETHQKASQVALHFSDLVLTSMLRGKKVMHLSQKDAFDYLPGESVIVPSGEKMLIDFPDADFQNPTQCIALVINHEKIADVLNTLNEKFPKIEKNESWQLNPQYFHLQNNIDIKENIDRIVSISRSSNLLKDVLTEITVQELLIRIMQTQARSLIFQNYQKITAHNRFAFVIQYIKENLTENLTIDMLSEKACMSSSHFFKVFKQEFGVSPLEYILHSRIELAKKLLKLKTKNITQVGYEVGFSSPAYFNRMFKKIVGKTPHEYKKAQY